MLNRTKIGKLVLIWMNELSTSQRKAWQRKAGRYRTGFNLFISTELKKS